MGDNLDKKNNTDLLSFNDESIYEISKLYDAWFLRYGMRDELMHTHTWAQTDNQKQYAP